MTFEIITILSLIIFMISREVMHFLQVTKLQELLKSIDITEYHKARKSDRPISRSENVVMQPNDIAIEGENFDIRKVSEVVIDGKSKPINIIS